jgi:hypothetical protein
MGYGCGFTEDQKTWSDSIGPVSSFLNPNMPLGLPYDLDAEAAFLISESLMMREKSAETRISRHSFEPLTDKTTV